jgi:hypothetical protein
MYISHSHHVVVLELSEEKYLNKSVILLERVLPQDISKPQLLH